MVLISHRGNISGENPERENSPGYIIEVLTRGYNAEIDVRLIDGIFWLGHDAPRYQIEESFLENDKLWCHAKNFAALAKMQQNKKIHFFWNQEDNFALTSKGFIWTYKSKEICPVSVLVKPEVLGITDKKKLPDCYGICSDFVANFNEI
ncbi:MAG: hypothetical protein A3B99_04305 [Candidatus Yanofskybacteria bacterium RIFCSPHIGHO2_02_FULL_44_12b]|uniref:GP-PDE domain-containing protein n=1 Tax=Candidatus Yanofskybacteria bacterium RIFCSPLOWO2_01_FULL_44_22 TaxID=1802697 RepID=A0A1F8GN83_9BACT|nr:MAG: hypothetical protein A2659_00535 [Candidatus Yanofskybacteria bacterium RIFCSPHIGHO2_01_FULL_44_24]OGN15735.1 MAG: hypothetical protein A3B99_04305 [Candidatus Yanofskybacteria bacterium RIFCSPHIGHO2_02_FULL_44_12b]OGN26791.1 MAG: hypothetical protein A2925_04390 [Candidatus Yanofskybacteria bacterium RIFCSPLOWO2_01_FULL_44_22]